MKEIFRLKEMLEKENIPFECEEHKDFDGYQIGYPVLPRHRKCICSAIQHKFSYGYDDDLIEIWGLSELDYDDVEGYLSAEDVFERIKNHYKEGGIDEKSL